MSPLSGSGLAVWVLNLLFGVGLPIEGSFWVRSCCLRFELIVGLRPTDIFITSLLSGSGLAVWVLNLLLGFGLPVEGHFSEWVFRN